MFGFENWMNFLGALQPLLSVRSGLRERPHTAIKMCAILRRKSLLETYFLRRLQKKRGRHGTKREHWKALGPYFTFLHFTSIYEHFTSIHEYNTYERTENGIWEFCYFQAIVWWSARRCSEMLVKCSEVTEMQSAYQGLSNAIIPKYFWQIIM